MPRYVVIGAGAIGVTFAAELKRAGNGVVLVARGTQLEAARNGGITYVRPDGARTLDVPVIGGPEELELRSDDILVLATKAQDAGPAVALWAQQPVTLEDGSVTRAGSTLTLLTTQNGLEAERVALRYFGTVIGGVLGLPAHFVEAGVVVAPGVPSVGRAWIGAYPDRRLDLVEELARALRRANIDAEAVDDITGYKRSKLAGASAFVLDALYQPSPVRDRAGALLRRESAAVLAGGGELPEISIRGRVEIAPTPGYAYGGSSTWQSLARSAASMETDYINGEVILQARLAGLPAPANAAVSARLAAVLAGGLGPRALTDVDLLEDFPELADGVGEPAGGVGEPAADPRAPAGGARESAGVAASRSPRQGVLVDAAALARELAGADAPALLDVRWKLGDPDGRRHHADAHIPGAVYVDLDTELARHGTPLDGRHPLPTVGALEIAARGWGLNNGQAVVVYDDNGGTSAARAWWLLRWAGVADVRILDGGLAAWTGSGRELETGAVAPRRAGDVNLSEGHLPTLSADEAAELAAGAAGVPGAAGGVLLDARAAERYRGEVEPVDPRAGHIPGAISAPTSENLGRDGRFLDDAGLRERFMSLGVDGDAPVGVYCGSGVTAAHEIAALAAVGIEAALFGGSWSAWSSDPARPAATGAAPHGEGAAPRGEGDPAHGEQSIQRSVSYAG